MAEKVIHLDTFKAYQDFRAFGPMCDEEWQRMREMIPICPMQGHRFDDFNMLYPFKIPRKPIVHVLSQKDEVFSMGVRYNHSQLVGVVGNIELMEKYNNYLGEFLFVVGKIKSKEKNDRVYYDIKPRGWLIVAKMSQEEEKI